jgi:hypothetical protein
MAFGVPTIFGTGLGALNTPFQTQPHVKSHKHCLDWSLLLSAVLHMHLLQRIIILKDYVDTSL